jgi:hypothetical protein
VAAVAAEIAVPLPLSNPVMLVVSVIAGVAPPLDVPAKPFADTTETAVTVPEPLLLNVVQSAALKAPRLVAEAVGTFSVITGVVVPLATVDERSVPVIPKVSAATEVTVP